MLTNLRMTLWTTETPRFVCYMHKNVLPSLNDVEDNNKPVLIRESGRLEVEPSGRRVALIYIASMRPRVAPTGQFMRARRDDRSLITLDRFHRLVSSFTDEPAG